MRKTTSDKRKPTHPRWVLFWRKVRTAAEELRRLEMEESKGKQGSKP